MSFRSTHRTVPCTASLLCCVLCAANLIYNEILAFARMKSACADEIQAVGLDEIKSTHPVLTPDFIPKGDFIIEDDFTHPQGWI